MNINPNDIIEHLARRVAELEVERGYLKAQVAALTADEQSADEA